MQLVDVGRNEPCPCGSGRKYKKCCLGARDLLVAVTSSDLDVAALVDRAIEDDEWEAVHEVFDQGFELFEPAAPLEHLRFREDQIRSLTPSVAELAKLWTSGWQRRCEQEIGFVLEHVDLEQGERDGLRMAVHLLRRFGARSPLVESLAELQAAERSVRARKFGDTVSKLGLTMDDVEDGWMELFTWIKRERPPILHFADWFSLRATPEENEVENLWLSNISVRVCDTALCLLERPNPRDPREYVQLAAITLQGEVPQLGLVLPQTTPPRVANADEQMVYEALVAQRPDDRLHGSIDRIAEATASRGDYAGAAMLRETMQRVRRRKG
jgi:hypothetical protein